jgi:NAD(P) transhydrogenase subunit alpha
LIDKQTKNLAINWDDELVKGTLIARDGGIVNAIIAERLGARPDTAAPAKTPSPKRQTKGGKG